MPVTVSHALSATTPDDPARLRQREANRRSYYKNLEVRRAYYRESTRKRRESDPAAYNEYQRTMQTRYRREAGVPVKQFNTPEIAKLKAKAQYARWSKSNPHMTAALAAKRRARKRLASPAWADHAAIRCFYAVASRVSKCTGIPHEVDHYYPLKGETVCGLHCEANLRILSMAENIRKSNKCP